MAYRLFKQKYQVRKTVKDADGTTKRVPVLDAGGNPVYREAAKWYIELTTDGMVRRIPGYTDKTATLQKAGKLQQRAAQEHSGLIDRFEQHRKRPLAEHLKDWQAHMLTYATELFANTRYSRAKKIVNGCHFVRWDDLHDAIPKIDAYLAKRRRGGEKLSVSTCNLYRQSVKGFCKWMAEEAGRAKSSPLANMRISGPSKSGNVRTDPRRIRRALTDDELRRLLEAAEKGEELYGLTGPIRSLMYRLVVETGLRQNEVRTLTSEAFDLDNDPPTVTVKAAYAKAGRDDELPLKPETAEALRATVGSTWPGQRVFPLPENRKQVMRILRADLKAAEIAYSDAQGRFADFHALRHTFITNLARAGVTPKAAMDLARHTDINLTMARYSHTRVEDRARAVAALPNLDQQPDTQEMRATGTEDKASALPECLPENLSEPLNRLASTGSKKRKQRPKPNPQSTSKKVNKIRGLAAIGKGCETVGSGAKEKADGGIRTHDPSFTKAVLYH